MGGRHWGYLELGPGTPPWVRGSIYKKKVLQDLGPNTHTAATIRKEVFTPPQKRGTEVRGGGGGGYGGGLECKAKSQLTSPPIQIMKHKIEIDASMGSHNSFTCHVQMGNANTFTKLMQRIPNICPKMRSKKKNHPHKSPVLLPTS